jgi:hypothetical protein
LEMAGAFDACPSLTAIAVSELNPVYSSGTGVLFDKSKAVLLKYPQGKVGNCLIPDSVRSVRDDAFKDCLGLSSIMIPNGVTNIGYGVFIGCTNLSDVAIGDGVTSIGRDAFGGCSRLDHVTIPNNVISVGDFAFYSCTSLTNIAVGSGLANLGEDAFYGCEGLRSITVVANNPAYRSEDGVLFNKSQTRLLRFPSAKPIASYGIPNGVTEIGIGAFESCGGLRSITIPNGVTNIGYLAFESCSQLTSITVPGSVSRIEDYAFYQCQSLSSVFFRGDAPSVGWSIFYGTSLNSVFRLPGTRAWATTFGGLPTALWSLPGPVVLIDATGVGLQTNRFGLTISWATNVPVVVEASTSLSHPVWLPVSTNSLNSGSAYYSDPDWKSHPTRFYRVRSR